MSIPARIQMRTYTESYIEKNPDKFYGENAAGAVTVEELPDEDSLREIVLASSSQSQPTPAVQTQPQKVVVQKKTSGGTWFVLVFGSLPDYWHRRFDNV